MTARDVQVATFLALRQSGLYSPEQARERAAQFAVWAPTWIPEDGPLFGLVCETLQVRPVFDGRAMFEVASAVTYAIRQLGHLQ